MLYNSKNKTLYFYEIQLTKQEEKFIYILANNRICTYEELQKNGISIDNARAIKHRLTRKTGMKLTTIAGVGWRLDEEDLFFI